MTNEEIRDFVKPLLLMLGCSLAGSQNFSSFSIIYILSLYFILYPLVLFFSTFFNSSFKHVNSKFHILLFILFLYLFLKKKRIKYEESASRIIRRLTRGEYIERKNGKRKGHLCQPPSRREIKQ